jgi:hypothetical protein
VAAEADRLAAELEVAAAATRVQCDAAAAAADAFLAPVRGRGRSAANGERRLRRIALESAVFAWRAAREREARAFEAWQRAYAEGR